MRIVNEILIDVSGSMGKTLKVGDKRKIDIAKEIIIEKILPLLNNSDSIGVRLFGGKCGIIGQLEIIPNADMEKLRNFILHHIPEPHGETPLALAIRTAVDSLRKELDVDRRIYCVTDGGETCGGDIFAEADYASRNDVKCRIDFISIGKIDSKSKEQFAYITKVTGGKNINIGSKGTSKEILDKELAQLNDFGVDEIVDIIDNQFAKNKEVFRLYDNKSISDYLNRKNLPINYIPGKDVIACHKLLVIEFYDDNKDLENLINGLEHVDKCKHMNKEILILMNKWDNDYYTKFFGPWHERFKAKGIVRFCIKLDGFKSYKEFQ
jgi:hypothetical protein